MSSSGPASIANNKGSSLVELSIHFTESLRLDVDLNNVGSRFHDHGNENGADRYPAATVVNDYDYGSLAASARLADEVDDITQQTTRASLEDSTSTGPVGPARDATSPSFCSTPQGPVYTSWQPRCTKTENPVTPSLDDLPVQRRTVGSSLAPQSLSEGSVNEAPRPAQAQAKRPSHDRPLLPANPVQRQHPPRMREEPPVAVQPPRNVLASQPQPQIAPRPLQFAPQTTEDYGCSECGKVFNRKSDLVHHKRYHTRNFDRPYKCEECGQGFIHYKDLARHMPRHTGQRSFQCPFPDCDKTYTRKDNLNRHVRHDHAADPNAPMAGDSASQPTATPAAEQKQDTELRRPSDTGSRPPSVGDSRHDILAVQAREPTPSNGKRSIDEVDSSERPAYVMKARRQPKEKWAHRLGCPFRKCRPEMFTTPLGYRVCHTTPHEFTIRLLEHLKRNHDIFVCGDCFLAFTSLEFLTQHKNTFVHCAECYLSFPDKNVLAAHSQSCVSVESSTQEDVWQIMYETICSDGVRHNPVFEEDDPVPQSIDRNNLERMERLRIQPPQPGQVASFNERLRSSISSASLGNDSAPPNSTADQQDRQQMAPAGANSFQTSHIAYSSSQTQQYRPQDFSHLQPHVATSHPVISHETIISAVTSSVFSTSEAEDAISTSIWHPESLDLESYDVEIQSVSPIRLTTTPVLKPLPVRAAEADLAVSSLPMAVQAYHCPSLTSESTTESQEQRFEVPHDIPHYSTMGLPQDPNLSIKQRADSFQYSWIANNSSNCSVCGAGIDTGLRYCEDCFAPSLSQ